MDRQEDQALTRAKRRLHYAVIDHRQRFGRDPDELKVSATDYLLLRSHELIDDDGLFRLKIKVRSA